MGDIHNMINENTKMNITQVITKYCESCDMMGHVLADHHKDYDPKNCSDCIIRGNHNCALKGCRK